ncbi:fatty acid desaturase-domain-containing protein [Aspergillus granulosus]|uniref:Fatty acid desaturase-domain-containing protein n=1 Tax=Aspergillus granulosus TaxID=176169 RepID=A0ABR4HYB9_9EURO
MSEPISLTKGDDKDEITLKTIRDAIPSHCFDRSLLISSAYVVRDFIYAGILFYLALQIDLLPSLPLRIAAWIAYGFFQGCVGTGIWILAHECGHGAFSPYQWINDIIGWALHSILLVPYFSWKITHARHHRYTNNTEKDTAFVPWTEKDMASKTSYLPEWLEMLEDTPVYSFVSLLAHQLAGWQTYLLFNVTAGPKSRPIQGKRTGWFQTNSHFDPTGALWTESQRHLIVISDLGLLLMGAAIVYLGQQVGLLKTVLIYFVPYLWVHHWLVAITYLHHTHKDIPHFTNDSWTFTRGALSTVDRDFGFIGRHFFHHIIDHHVVHHLFSRIPFYRAEEATNAIIPVLGDKYHHDDSGFMRSLVKTWGECTVVGDVSGKKDGVLHWILPKKVE